MLKEKKLTPKQVRVLRSEVPYRGINKIAEILGIDRQEVSKAFNKPVYNYMHEVYEEAQKLKDHFKNGGTFENYPIPESK